MGRFITQSYAAFAGCLSVISMSMAYAWISPVLNQLEDPTGEIRASKEQISWLASIIEVGSLITPFPASLLADRFGRKLTLLCHVPLFVVSWILVVTTRSVFVLYVKRVLDGLAIGVVNTITPIYLAEISNPEIRGAILVAIPVSYYFGVLLQFCIGTYLPYAVTAEVCLVFLVLFFILFSFLPESPYYFMMTHQEDRAARSLEWLRCAHSNQISEELRLIEEYIQKDTDNHESWKTIYQNSIYRRNLLTMMTVVSAVIITGLPVIFSYATEIFSDASNGFLNPDICSIACALILLLTTIIAFILIDKVGRRPLVVLSAFGCFISNLCSTLYFYFKDSISFKWTPFATIASYCFFVSIGLTPVLCSYQGELFPTSMKGIASGITVTAMTCCTFLTVKIFYVIESASYFYINYLLYTVVGGITSVLLYINAPETKNKTFKELYDEFERRYKDSKYEYRTVHGGQATIA